MGNGMGTGRGQEVMLLGAVGNWGLTVFRQASYADADARVFMVSRDFRLQE
jgi:hypothetical protein